VRIPNSGGKKITKFMVSTCAFECGGGEGEGVGEGGGV